MRAITPKLIRTTVALGTLLLGSSFVHALEKPKPTPRSPEEAASRGAVAVGELRTLEWEDLIPQEERDRPYVPARRVRPLFDDESGPMAEQEGSVAVNASLNGQQVKIPGFVVPLTTSKDAVVTTFLLVPYFGACIHVPPPPPNQIVYVEMQKPFRLHEMYAPVWVTGKMSTQSASTGMATAAYTLTGTKIENYEEPP
jgi:hypothetical protein